MNTENNSVPQDHAGGGRRAAACVQLPERDPQPGDRVMIKSLSYLNPLYRGKAGTVMHYAGTGDFFAVSVCRVELLFRRGEFDLVACEESTLIRA